MDIDMRHGMTRVLSRVNWLDQHFRGRAVLHVPRCQKADGRGRRGQAGERGGQVGPRGLEGAEKERVRAEQVLRGDT